MNFTRAPNEKAKLTTSSADWHTWALLVVLLLGMALRLYQLATDSFWLDEITTAVYVQQPDVPGVLDHLTDRSGRPLHFVLVFLITYLGDNEFWLRLPSVAFGVLGLVTTYKLGQILFGRTEGLLAAFLLAISPFDLRYSQEARSYALFMWLSLLSFYFLLLAWRTGRWRWWIGFTASSILNTYTHYFSFLVLATEVLAVGVLLGVGALQERGTGRPLGKAAWQGLRRVLIPMAFSLAIIALAFLPSWTHLQGFLGRQGDATGAAPGLELTLPFFVGVANTFAIGQSGTTMAYSAWLYLALALIGVVACLHGRWLRPLLLVLVWIVFPFAVLFAVPAEHFFALHYLIFVPPLFLLLVARGLTGIGAWLRGWAGRRMAVGKRLVPALGMAALLVLGLLAIRPLTSYYSLDKEDWRAAIAYLKARVQPGDLIICDGVRRGGQDSYRPCRALQVYFGSAFEENLVARETAVASTIEPVAQEDRGVWGLVFGNLGRWMPETPGISVVAFTLTAVIQLEQSEGTVLDRSITLLESFPEFMAEEGRFDVHLELVKLYAMQGDMGRAHEHLQLAETVMPEDTRAAEAWASIGDWLQAWESGP